MLLFSSIKNFVSRSGFRDRRHFAGRQPGLAAGSIHNLERGQHRLDRRTAPGHATAEPEQAVISIAFGQRAVGVPGVDRPRLVVAMCGLVAQRLQNAWSRCECNIVRAAARFLNILFAERYRYNGTTM